ncbi:hypothetical protein GS491_22630 [Rhodococcus hoagii]|nr:hypothetical protein [Prescottella equi]NKR80045.1 hypothetical protein [Prescottella equi]NKT01842.1 hypothetical protein [Prescottella equi]
MHDKNTAETLEEAIARLTALLEGRWWMMEQSKALFEGWRVAAPLPSGATHQDANAAGHVEAEGPDLAPLVTRLADKVAEALAMRGAA